MRLRTRDPEPHLDRRPHDAHARLFRLSPLPDGSRWLAFGAAARSALHALCAELDAVFDAPAIGASLVARDNCFRAAIARALTPYALSSRLWRLPVLLTPSQVLAGDGLVQNAAGAATLAAVRRMMQRVEAADCPIRLADLDALHARLTTETLVASAKPAYRTGSLHLTWSRWWSTPPIALAATLRIHAALLGDTRLRASLGAAIALPLCLLLVHPYADGNGRCARALSLLRARSVLGAATLAPTVPVFLQGGPTLYRYGLVALAEGDHHAFVDLLRPAARAWQRLVAQQTLAAQAYRDEWNASGATLFGVPECFAETVVLDASAWLQCANGLSAAQIGTLRRHYAYDAATDAWINRTALRHADRLAGDLYRAV